MNFSCGTTARHNIVGKATEQCSIFALQTHEPKVCCVEIQIEIVSVKIGNVGDVDCYVE